jgi:hypothetical protein
MIDPHIRIHPSVIPFINNHDHNSSIFYHLQLVGQELHAKRTHDPLNHTIKSTDLNQLKLQSHSDPDCSSIIKALHLQVEERISIAKQTAARDRFPISPPPSLKEKLHEWCDEAIGTPEYKQRLITFKLFKDYFEANTRCLAIHGLDITTLPDFTTEDLPYVESFFIGDCPSLTNFPTLIGVFPHLKEMIVSMPSMTAFPDLDGNNLPLLQRIHLVHCTHLTTTPILSHIFPSLDTLALLNVGKLTSPIVLNPENFPKFKRLFVCDSLFPDIVGKFPITFFLNHSPLDHPSYTSLGKLLPTLIKKD